jgi:hypothetical protein
MYHKRLKCTIVTRVVERHASSNFACLLAKVYNVSYKSQAHVEICNSQEEKEIGKDDIQIHFSIIQGFG